MKVKDTKGRTHSWNLTGYIVPPSSLRPRSELHITARSLIREAYPTDQVLEEVPIQGEGLYGDFYLPLRKKMIEVHGEQHYKYISFFHTNIKGFMESKERDKRKQDWCNINEITLVVLKFNEVESWLSQIVS